MPVDPNETGMNDQVMRKLAHCLILQACGKLAPAPHRCRDILVRIRIRGSVPLTNGSGVRSLPRNNGSGSRRPKNLWIRIRIRNTRYHPGGTRRIKIVHRDTRVVEPE